jgi:exodeoxyribonuclease VII large subunit
MRSTSRSPTSWPTCGRSRPAKRRTSIERRVSQLRDRLEWLANRPALRQPKDGVFQRARRVDELSLRLDGAVRSAVRETRATVVAAAGKLESLSPLGVLGRGYSLTFKTGSDRLIKSADALKVGERITTQFASGEAVSVVERTNVD